MYAFGDEIKVLYQDDDYVVVHKPCGLLVHRSFRSTDKFFLLQELRNQIGKKLYPVHRLDRPTSGVIAFALNQKAAREFSNQIQNHQIKKEYLAVVRGYTENYGIIDYPISIDKSKPKQVAITHFERVAIASFDISCSKYATSRYSLVRCYLETGRYHQIRKHFAHISHHLIGDTMHGKGEHNRIFREKFGLTRLLLIAKSLEFYHYKKDERLKIITDLEDDFAKFIELPEWKYCE